MQFKQRYLWRQVIFPHTARSVQNMYEAFFIDIFYTVTIVRYECCFPKHPVKGGKYKSRPIPTSCSVPGTLVKANNFVWKRS